MAIAITGDLSWTGALVLFLEALDGGPAADVAGYAFTSSGDLEYSCSVSEPVDPDDRLLGVYRCVAKTAGGVIAGVGYVTIGATTTAVRIRSDESTALDPATQEQIDTIEERVTSSQVITAIGFGIPDASGALLLKRGHTATLTFTSATSNIVTNLSGDGKKVFFGVRTVSGNLLISGVEGTVLVATGLQSVQFTLTAEQALALVAGVHLYDVVCVYGYNATLDPPYTSMEPFTGGYVRVQEVGVDLAEL